jgi:hypothetical protein
MKSARRFPQRLVRWPGLCVCLALVLTSLAMTPLGGPNNLIALAQGRSDSPNGKGRKVSPAPPLPGAPEASLPSLEEARQRPHVEPIARQPIPSILRSRRKPLESRQGRKVGDPLPPKRRASANETGNGSEPVLVASAAARDHVRRVGTARSHYARTTRLLPPAALPQGALPPAALGSDIRPLSFYFSKHRNVPALNHPAFNFLRYPALIFPIIVGLLFNRRSQVTPQSST